VKSFFCCATPKRPTRTRCAARGRTRSRASAQWRLLNNDNTAYQVVRAPSMPS
jgi:hypothetical protein